MRDRLASPPGHDARSLVVVLVIKIWYSDITMFRRASTPSWDIRKQLMDLSADLGTYWAQMEVMNSKGYPLEEEKELGEVRKRYTDDENFWEEVKKLGMIKHTVSKLLEAQSKGKALTLSPVLIKHYPIPVQTMLLDLHAIHVKRDTIDKLYTVQHALYQKIKTQHRQLKDILGKAQKDSWGVAVENAWCPIGVAIIISAMDEELDGNNCVRTGDAPYEEEAGEPHDTETTTPLLSN